MAVAERIEEKLRRAFAPTALEVVDESAAHAGHAGLAEHGGRGETHFRVHIVAERFQGLSRLDRQRAVNAVLAEELAGPVHALSISAQAPDRAGDGG